MKFSFKHSMKWSIFISFITFFLAGAFSIASTILLDGFTWGIGMLIVFVLIFIGIIFDVMGLASAAAKEVPFHAMASEKIKGAKEAIQIVRNADRFASFCNDMIGDVTGIISGAATAIVVVKLLSTMHDGTEWIATAVSVVFTGMVSAITVAGKAMGKSLAIHYATEIVLIIGKFFHFLEHRLRIRVFNGKKSKSSNNGKRGNKRAARTNQSA